MKNRNNIITTILLTLSLLALPHGTQAVSPAPDGGYPGGNTAEGQSALLNLTTGAYNTAAGFLSLASNTDGPFNTAIGAGTLLANTADDNTAIGAGALLSNTNGDFNTASGVFALFSNTVGFNNTADGVYALFTNLSGIRNTANGAVALFLNTGSFNTADGADALRNNAAGEDNTAVGAEALENNTSGGNNTAVGQEALGNNSSGSNNVALGHSAGSALTTGDNNIDIGNNVVGIADEHDTIRIGNTNVTDTFIRGISGTTVAGGAGVFVASDGHLGTMTSSKRFKEEIKPMDKASEAIFSLKPVTFRYKKQLDPARIQQFGLVAEDVEKVDPGLVVHDGEGKVNSVRYEQVNAMLLNEFLKEHRTVLDLKQEIAVLAATVRKQAAQIQKVSAQVEAATPVAQMVVNP